MRRTWGSEFEGMTMPEEVVAMTDSGRLTDESWHNDACPSFTARGADGLTVRLWVEYRDPEMREYPSLPRYHVTTESGQGDVVATLYAGDDLQAALKHIP